MGVRFLFNFFLISYIAIGQNDQIEYIPNTKETWLPLQHNNEKMYTNTESANTCRIQFNVLKKRFDSSGKNWNGVITWQF